MKCPDCFREMTLIPIPEKVSRISHTHAVCIYCYDERIKMDDRKAKYQQEGDDE